MSTLKVTHLQNENGTGPAMSIAVGGGVTFAGISTFYGAIDLQTPTDLRVAAGATIGGSTNTITASTNGEERLRIDSSGDIEIAQGKNLTWVYEGGSTHRARIRAESTDALIFENGSGNTEQLRITSAGRVGIKTTNPDELLEVGNGTVSGALKVSGQSSSVTSDGFTVDWESSSDSVRLFSEPQSGGSSQFKIYTTNSGTRSLAATFDSSGNLAFPNGQGIDFSATADSSGTTTSELLDDYEEGSFSPTIVGWNGDFTTQFGRYTKIGQLVHLFGEVTTTGGTGTFTFTWPGPAGFPFTGNVNGSSAKGMWFLFGGGTGLTADETLSGPLDGPGSGATSAFPNHLLTGTNTGNGNFSNANLNAASNVTYRFFITYTSG